MTAVRAHRTDDALQAKIRGVLREIQIRRKNEKKNKSKRRNRQRKMDDCDEQIKFGTQRFGKGISDEAEASSVTIPTKDTPPAVDESKTTEGTTEVFDMQSGVVESSAPPSE